MNIMRLTNSKKSSTSQQVPFDPGAMKVKLGQLGSKKAVRDTTTSKTSKTSTAKVKLELKQSAEKRKSLSMPECHPLIKKVASTGKFKSSKQNTRMQKSSKTSEVHSTIKGKASGCYWTKLLQEVSTSLSSCTRTDSVDSLTTCSDTSSRSKALKSKWFQSQTKIQKFESALNKNWHKISSLLLTTLSQKTMVKDQEKIENKSKKPKPTQAMKYRIYPSKALQSRYQELFDAQRDIKNAAIKVIENYHQRAREFRDSSYGILNASLEASSKYELDLEFKPVKDKNDKIIDIKIQTFPSKTSVCRLLINKGSAWLNEHLHIASLEANFRAEAVREVMKDYKSSLSRYTKDKRIFKMRFHSYAKEKMYGCSFPIQLRHWTAKKGFWSNLLPNGKRCRDKSSKTLPDKIEYAARIQRKPGNKYYVCIPTAPKPLSTSIENLLVLDPGLRTFLTGINFADNLLEEIGVGMSYNLSRRLRRLNKLIGKLSKKNNPGNEPESQCSFTYNHRERCHFKRVILRERARLTNMIDDLQKSVSKYMCENYSMIVIPKLDFHSMKRLSKHQKSIAALLSHCRFVDVLMETSKRYQNCKVFVTTEEYTSKTCSRCGHLHMKLGASKVFDCPACKSKMDRDENAVYNILMKTITDISSEFTFVNSRCRLRPSADRAVAGY